MVFSGVLRFYNIPQFIPTLSTSHAMCVRWRFSHGRTWLGVSLAGMDVYIGVGTLDRLFWLGIDSHWTTNCISPTLTMNSTNSKGSSTHMCQSIFALTSTSVLSASPSHPSCAANHEQKHWIICCNMTGPDVTASRELRHTLSKISTWRLCMFIDRHFVYLRLQISWSGYQKWLRGGNRTVIGMWLWCLRSTGLR